MLLVRDSLCAILRKSSVCWTVCGGKSLEKEPDESDEDMALDLEEADETEERAGEFRLALLLAVDTLVFTLKPSDLTETDLSDALGLSQPMLSNFSRSVITFEQALVAASVHLAEWNELDELEPDEHDSPLAFARVETAAAAAALAAAMALELSAFIWDKRFEW
ncbi:hypothetical protein BpHYR1_046239 [Brachionus plicatilis]|uniref:Uncharacterized protein n=1 Tax=Brachionus plicatilis TaxID=10195 RepID=A0A3M7PGB3_BRAPC|nr:hypothetical protein BpHYR1_046239 [Brachionus plicatilis]